MVKHVSDIDFATSADERANTAQAEGAVHLTAEIVSAYVSNNNISAAELPALIKATYTALIRAGAAHAPEPVKLTPPVPIKKSITHDHLISLEDGKPYKSLKRHLATLGLTPEDYRAKWGLAKDYPMVAAAYSEQRSNLAKSLGLGRKAGSAAPAKVAAKVIVKRGPKAKSKA